MKVSDEILMAYVDGEVDDQTRAAVETAMQADANVAQRVARQQALRQQLRGEFDGVLHEPVPERLTRTARTAPVASPTSSVTDLSRARNEKRDRTPRRWSLPQWSAMAASLVLGVFVGQAILRSPASSPIVARDGRLVAQDSLAEALSNQLASDQAAKAPVQVGLSFRSKTGEFCRTFVWREGDGLAGLACREGEIWQIETAVPNETLAAGNGSYQMAGAELPLAVLQAVEGRIDGEPLDASGEAAARQKGWR
jgi:hypothetical protein